MLEILIIWQLCKDLRKGVIRRGYESAAGYQFLLVVMWFVGEIAGAIIGSVILDSFFAAYLCALAGAVAGGIGAFYITKAFTPAKQVGPLGAFTGGFPVMPATPVAAKEEERI